MVLAYVYRDRLFGLDLPIRIGCVVALVILGWAFAMNLGRAVGPLLTRRLDPGTAGTVGFLIRLATLLVTVLAALRLAGLNPQTPAMGGAITAVILGLAAQQTVGNLIAGTVFLSARPFRVGERIRVHAGGGNGADRIMVPNNVVLSAAIVPLRKPDGVDVLARLESDIRPSDVQQLLRESISVETRSEPEIELEEMEGRQVISGCAPRRPTARTAPARRPGGGRPRQGE